MTQVNKLEETIREFCKKCEKETEFYYLGVQNLYPKKPIYYVYNCSKCETSRGMPYFKTDLRGKEYTSFVFKEIYNIKKD